MCIIELGVSERRMTKSDLPLATNNLTPPTEIIVTTPKIEEIKQEEDLFYVYVDNVLLQSVPSQPSANVHKLVLKICHKQNFDIDKFVFKDKAGQTIDLQPTTLQKHLPDKYIAFVKRDIDEQGMSI